MGRMTIRHGIALVVSVFALLTIILGSRPAARLAAAPGEQGCDSHGAPAGGAQSRPVVRPG